MKYWEVLNDVVQKDLVNDEDRAMYGLMQFLGIEKGKPFNPSPEMTKLLTKMEDLSYKTAQAIGFSEHYAPRYYDNGTDWTRIFLTPVDPKDAREAGKYSTLNTSLGFTREHTLLKMHRLPRHLQH
jgi:hypothetical protein